MKTLLIIGELPYSKEKKELYKKVVKIGGKYFKTVLSPIDTLAFELTPEQRYKRAFKSVADADVIIAECSNPSSGQGMEIRESVLLGKELLIIAEEGSKVSGLILASPNLKMVTYYDNLSHLNEKLEEYFI